MAKVPPSGIEGNELRTLSKLNTPDSLSFCVSFSMASLTSGEFFMRSRANKASTSLPRTDPAIGTETGVAEVAGEEPDTLAAEALALAFGGGFTKFKTT